MDGIIIIDKPKGLTSHDVVHRVRRLTGERSVGHLGTLDPMATGVLPLVLGRMTRLAQFYAGAEKAYDGEIQFGYATDTYDADGEPVGPRSDRLPSFEAVAAAAAEFVGRIKQVPPPFSAKKISGVPAYKLARRKKEVVLQPVEVEVHEFTILRAENGRVAFRARVASGTYLRSITHDLGLRLGTGAHLASLRRTRVGEFGIEQAVDLARVDAGDLECPITDIMSTINKPSIFLHPRTLLPHFPAITAPPDVLPRLLHGNAVNLPEFSGAELVKVFRGQNELVAVCRRIAGSLFQPKVVLADAVSAVTR